MLPDPIVVVRAVPIDNDIGTVNTKTGNYSLRGKVIQQWNKLLLAVIHDYDVSLKF